MAGLFAIHRKAATSGFGLIAAVLFAGSYATIFHAAARACPPLFASFWPVWEILRNFAVLASQFVPPACSQQLVFAAAILNAFVILSPLLCIVPGRF